MTTHISVNTAYSRNLGMYNLYIIYHQHWPTSLLQIPPISPSILTRKFENGKASACVRRNLCFVLRRCHCAHRIAFGKSVAFNDRFRQTKIQRVRCWRQWKFIHDGSVLCVTAFCKHARLHPRFNTEFYSNVHTVLVWLCWSYFQFNFCSSIRPTNECIVVFRNECVILRFAVFCICVFMKYSLPCFLTKQRRSDTFERTVFRQIHAHTQSELTFHQLSRQRKPQDYNLWYELCVYVCVVPVLVSYT